MCSRCPEPTSTQGYLMWKAGASTLVDRGRWNRPWGTDQEEKTSRYHISVVLFNMQTFAFQTRTRAPVTNRPHFYTHHLPQSHANKSLLWFYYPLMAPLISDAGRRGGRNVIHPIDFLTGRQQFINEMYVRCTSSSLPRQQSRVVSGGKGGQSERHGATGVDITICCRLKYSK